MTLGKVRQIRQETARRMGEDDGLSCWRCRQSANRETLSAYAGMCGPCFGAYCRETRAPAPITGGRSEWAFSLKARHDAGERLTPAQVDAYRCALLRGDVPQESEA